MTELYRPRLLVTQQPLNAEIRKCLSVLHRCLAPSLTALPALGAIVTFTLQVRALRLGKATWLGQGLMADTRVKVMIHVSFSRE